MTKWKLKPPEHKKWFPILASWMIVGVRNMLKRKLRIIWIFKKGMRMCLWVLLWGRCSDRNRQMQLTCLTNEKNTGMETGEVRLEGVLYDRKTAFFRATLLGVISRKLVVSRKTLWQIIMCSDTLKSKLNTGSEVAWSKHHHGHFKGALITYFWRTCCFSYEDSSEEVT